MPHEVVLKMVDLLHKPFAGHLLPEHMLASLKRFGMGFGLAALIGVPLGLAMGWFRLLDDIVSPLFDGLRFIAPVAWVPFAALWFGTGVGGPTLIIFAGAFPPCLINAYRGARNVDVRFLEAASMLGVGHFRTITEVLFPAAVPSIIAGLRIGAGLGWMSLVGAELIVASSGMGNLIVRAQSALATDTVMAGMIAIGMVGVVIDVLIRRLERWLLKHRSA
jgi:NitT/TauT family transport system permease protein